MKRVSAGGKSTLAIDDPALGQIVGGDFDSHAVARDDPDEILAHLSGDVGKNLVTIFEFDHKLRIRQGFDNLAFRSHRLFFRHTDLHKTAAHVRRNGTAPIPHTRRPCFIIRNGAHEAKCNLLRLGGLAGFGRASGKFVRRIILDLDRLS